MLLLTFACAAPATPQRATEAPAEATAVEEAATKLPPRTTTDLYPVQGNLVIGITEYAPMNYYDKTAP
jgi:hypothetical protein